MNSFLDNFQPTIVQFSDDPCVPLSCRGRYMLCINITGIKWFEENFLKLEIGGLIEGEALGPSLLMLEDSGANKLDVPRVYVPINEDLVKSDALLGKFLISGLTDNLVYAEGIEYFRPGQDYYVNETLYKWIVRKEDHQGNLVAPIDEENDDIVLPDYLVYDDKTETCSLSDAFNELTDEEKKTKNFKYFLNKNKMIGMKFSDDELENLASTFFKYVLEYTMIEDSARTIYPNNGYDAVMKYFANFKSDAATVLLQTIFNQDIVDDNANDNVTYKCNSCSNTITSMSGSSTIEEKSCYEKYKDAMDIWLSSMLASIDYYNDWFMIRECDSKYANYDLIDILIDLLKSAIGYNHYPMSEKSKKKYGCSCPSLDSSYDDESDCNKNILMNYIKVLEWTKKCELKQNTNKIRVYGKEFATLLSKY